MRHTDTSPSESTIPPRLQIEFFVTVAVLIVCVIKTAAPPKCPAPPPPAPVVAPTDSVARWDALLVERDTARRERDTARAERDAARADVGASVRAQSQAATERDTAQRDAVRAVAARRAAEERVERERWARLDAEGRLANLASESRSREPTLRQELLGLNGSLDRVVFILDTSGSMKGPRWEAAARVVETWVSLLPVREAVFLTFADDVTAVKIDGRELVEMTPETRGRLVAALQRVTPAGATNTVAAFRKAYSYPGVTALVVFTDGAPTLSNDFDPAMATEVLAMCRRRGPGCPAHVCALGNYFDPRLSAFLLGIADCTGGSYRGM